MRTTKVDHRLRVEVFVQRAEYCCLTDNRGQNDGVIFRVVGYDLWNVGGNEDDGCQLVEPRDGSTDSRISQSMQAANLRALQYIVQLTENC